jgi:hypothetical protein
MLHMRTAATARLLRNGRPAARPGTYGRPGHGFGPRRNPAASDHHRFATRREKTVRITKLGRLEVRGREAGEEA